MRSRRVHATGDRIADRYEILEFAGEGGMQEVYLAEDLHLSRRVAVKTPKNASADKRFERSAIVSAQVNHPNVAKTLDYINEGEAQYLVEEFIEGKDIKKGLLEPFFALDPSLVAKILHHLAKGLAASHRAGVVHRDLKPSNVMFVGGPEVHGIKITDFGIAKMAKEEIDDAVVGGDETMSASKTVVGALPYMAPEVLKSQESTGKESDIWSAGAMIYELLTGDPPYGRGFGAVAKIMQAEIPDRPIRFPGKTQFKPLASDLADIVLHCLSPNPVDRPNAEALSAVCADLCYTVSERRFGECVFLHSSGAFGKIREDDGSKVFFNNKSVYGPRLTVGAKVCFSCFPGYPNPRAHPVLLLNEEDRP
ncbi:serine/threonine protein kinase [Synechococcus sp. HJ21-Hayes]|uniref:serine/threonine-protein kinase n=1 Tax=unclassified Synechococcus TaxID=2626047 RepID=UPI0020CEBB6A|nr:MULTISPECIES: serine/threonine-protein kinase [unclassified Synechococcus]MCP9832150.1 serine/threonine protein kinase [Synechococcus sp. JJ3a-Johnson]MCP9853706.1 serine/threonine protein kinase [Synechococcus sp. HJ21-Hayes]